ncbi:MAG: hypothetical protein A2Z88_02595 [Omnitrophica WOR_2 bacterium GWA2_47_8]|nr:MAG: hypothetical protein A2Z88_02595 [Omnitrophica WOR_2 bacterium GWA2_47_8]
MLDKMKQMMEIKKQADQLKRTLDGISVDVAEVPGIKVVITGGQDFKSVEIDADLLKAENKKRFEQGLLRSLNAAIKKSQQLAAEKMKSVMPGLPF